MSEPSEAAKNLAQELQLDVLDGPEPPMIQDALPIIQRALDAAAAKAYEPIERDSIMIQPYRGSDGNRWWYAIPWDIDKNDGVGEFGAYARTPLEAIRALAPKPAEPPCPPDCERPLPNIHVHPLKQAEQPDHDFVRRLEGGDHCHVPGCGGLPESAHRRAEEKR